MRYVKIREKTYNEAMMKLKMEYGEDAIPISHKYVKEGGILNSRLFAKDVVELTAAVQDKRLSAKAFTEKKRIDITVDDGEKNMNRATSPAGISAGMKHRPQDDVNMASLSRSIDSLNDNLNDLKVTPRNRVARPSLESAMQKNSEEAPLPVTVNDRETGNDAKKGAIAQFEKEFSDIKETLKKLVGEKSSECAVKSPEKNDLIVKSYLDILRNNDYDQDQCSHIMNEIKNSMSRDDLCDKVKIEKSLKELLKSRIITTGPIKMGNKKKIIMFIGPTGVGKTTTMAKLGAIYSLREGHKVTFITIDNYRIAATEQLKKYAEIMRIPVHAVNNQKEFKEVITREKAEIIMVDTSGRSHRNDLKISEMKTFAEQVEYDFEKILCVSANTKKRDISDVFKAFDTIHFNSVIITKVDETSFLGNIVDIADKFNKPISYFTNGQEVPNDIVVADPDKIVDMMIGNINN